MTYPDKSFIPKNKRLVFDGARMPSRNELEQARGCVERAGFAERMERHLKRRRDGLATLSVQGLEVAKALRGFEQGHEMLLIDICRIINTFDDYTLRQLGMPKWHTEGGYDRVDRLTGKMARALEEGFADVDPETNEITRIDLQWYLHAVLRASVPMDVIEGCALALDGTDMPTWGALHTGSSIELDGEDDRPSEEGTGIRNITTAKKARIAKVFGVGPDGRNIYTKDKDARAGHRSATGQRVAGPYIGREAHLGVAVQAVKWTDGVDRVTFGPSMPQLVLTANLVPAGTHRGKAVTESIHEAKQLGFCQEVIVDPGYSLLNKHVFHMLLMQYRVPLTMHPASHQRTRMYLTPESLGGGLVIDGQLFSRHMPSELWYLPMPERGASAEERRGYQAKFKLRAAYAYTRHKSPGVTGITRWRCPFCAGKLRSRQLPHTMRQARNKPLVTIPEGQKCCDGIVSVGADQLPLMQNTIFGTPAWAKSYGRRNLVETTNAALKGLFTTIERGYVRSLLTSRIILVFAHTLAGYNRWALQSWAKMQRHLAEQAEQKLRIRDRRANTLRRFDDYGFTLPKVMPNAPAPKRVIAPIVA